MDIKRNKLPKDTKSVNTRSVNCDIIIVTYDNEQIFGNCIKSIIANTMEPFRLVVVNNGSGNFNVMGHKDAVIIKTPKNLGWMGGVNAGVKWCLENSEAPFICWMNDDIQILDHDYGWLTKMIRCFELDEAIGGVGPTSNAVMAYQSTQHIALPPAIETTMLSGMCFLTKREVVAKVGLIDEKLCGGDDIDYSIRLADAGYKLCVCRRVFMLHYCGVTGRKVFGNYWNSTEQYEAINNDLIKKHGFKKWFSTVNHQLPGGLKIDPNNPKQAILYDFVSPEDEICFSELSPILDAGGIVLDLGCGGKKFDDRAIGVDIRNDGDLGVGYNLEHPAIVDINSDVSRLDDFKDRSVSGLLARHIFEHILDPIPTLKEWRRVLSDDGKLVIICPDYRYSEAISCDPSHCHAYTPSSIQSLLDCVGGFKVINVQDVRPGYVFAITVQKVPAKVLVEV